MQIVPVWEECWVHIACISLLGFPYIVMQQFVLALGVLSHPPPPPPPLTYSCDCPPFKTKLLKHSLLFLPFLHSVVLYYTCTLTLCVSSTVHSPAGYILHKKRNQIIILSHPCLLKLVYTSLLLIVDTKLLALKSYSNYYITSTRECLLTQPMYGPLY